MDANKESVKKQLAFYFSTRSYSKVLEVHGFEDLGLWLHEMSLKQQWDQMSGVITDEILDVFAIVGGYSEIPALMKERFEGQIDEVVFNAGGPGISNETEIQNVIKGLQG